MFAIQRKQENGFDKIILHHTISLCRVEIVPACGAMLHAFWISDDQKKMNVIDSYTSKEQFDTQAESAGFKGLKLSPFPCRIQDAAYIFNEKEYHFKKVQPNGAALHGLLYREAFDVVEEVINDSEASVSLLCEYAAVDPGYPFTYNCTVTYTLKAGNTLIITTTVTNKGQSPMPVADGWHPYFSFGRKVDGLELQFASDQMLEFVNLIPSGKVLTNKTFITGTSIGATELDNSFVLDFAKAQPLCVLRDPVSKWQLELYPRENYPYLQLYIPPHRNSIAIENLSAPPDSFNNGMGLIILQPGEAADFSVKYIVRKRD
ncbi:MAG: aldose 1-epimerase [Agriterribacter sp.]